MLTISANQQQNALVISLEGRIDANSAKELEQQCMAWIGEGEKNLVMDFTLVNFISSAGLRVVLLVAKKLDPMQGSVRLCGLNNTLRDVFEISGFSKLFVITGTVAEALQAGV